MYVCLPTFVGKNTNPMDGMGTGKQRPFFFCVAPLRPGSCFWTSYGPGTPSTFMVEDGLESSDLFLFRDLCGGSCIRSLFCVCLVGVLFILPW